jgi:hypothetical protein
MADRGREWRGKKASGGWESVEGVEEDGGAALVLLHIHRPSKSRDGGGSNGGGGAVHGRHAPATCPAVEAFPRARGVQRSGRRGRRFRAFSGPN